MKRLKLTIFLCISSLALLSQKVQIVRQYDVPASRQAVAVDDDFFYVVNNMSLTKHDKKDGRLLATWKDPDSLVHHLNSGIVIDGKLYTCNSNYPESPMASSIEVFDPKTLEHIGHHSFGISNGSATWIDYFEGHWYVVFAHYTGRGADGEKDNSWTRITKFNKDWIQTESWIFPKPLLTKFGTRSNSGGFILRDGTIFCTGHDEPEIYVLKFPKTGYTLQWVGTIPMGAEGQGISYEEEEGSLLIYGIIKKDGKVIVTRVSDPQSR